MKLSILAPYWDRPLALRAFLERWGEILRGRNDFEVIVVDDGPTRAPAREVMSSSGAVRLLELPAKTITNGVVTDPNPGIVWNHAFNNCSGDHLILTHCDVLPRDDFVDRWVEVCGKDGYVYGPIWDVKNRYWCLPNHNNLPGNQCAMISRDRFVQVGGFDPELRAGYAFDDEDFVFRLLAMNTIFSFDINAICDHRLDLCWQGEVYKDDEQFCRNRDIVRRRYGGIRTYHLMNFFPGKDLFINGDSSVTGYGVP